MCKRVLLFGLGFPLDNMSPIHSLTIGWSPVKKLWHELTHISGEIRWNRVDLDTNRSHQVPHQDIGVYLICAHPPSEAVKDLNAYTVLYAGQVNSRNRGLRTRFLEHIRHPSPKLRMYVDCYYPSLHFWFAVIREPSEIDALESLLIATFNPPCNSIRAPGSPALLARLGTPTLIGAGRKHYSA